MHPVPTLEYAEEPGVKELHKGYKLFPKGTMRVLGSYRNLARNIFILLVAYVHIVVVAIISVRYFNLSVPWTTVSVILLGAALFTPLLYAPSRDMLKSKDSPLAGNRERRSEIKRTRAIAKQLGESVVPVLTEEHVKTIQQLHTDLVLAGEAIGKGITFRPTDYDRLAVLLLEDIKKERLICDLIINRGLHSMDDIEAALREIEADTIGPVQSGWL